MRLTLAATGLLTMLTAATGLSEESYDVPDEEKAIARDAGTEGPSETTGVGAVVELGYVELVDDFPSLSEFVLVARKVTLEPGGSVSMHQHETRPGVLYVLEGEMTEYRNDAAEPIVRQAGDTSFEKAGVIHGWRNNSTSDAVGIIVQIRNDVAPAGD